MKKSLSHLPPYKRKELRLIRDRICEHSCEACQIEMIILFGSHARGDWVEDVYFKGHTRYEYKSDFDILLIAADPKIDRRFGLLRILNERAEARPVQTHVSLIAHDIDYVNEKLSKGQYFFSDIKKEGILLYDSKKYKLARRRKLDPKQRRGMARSEFEEWFTSANGFYDQFEYALRKKEYKIAAFQLHQATERYFKAILLVFTNYKPKGHDLRDLKRMAGSYDPAFLTVFPLATPEQEHRFDLLRRAYVEARYHRGYKITPEELDYLAKCVRKLRNLTKKICKAKIESFV